MSTGPRQFNLLFRGQTVWLPPGQLYLGRSVACHVVVDDPMVSRQHASLMVTTQNVTIEDLNSINGVYVNGERLLGEPLELQPDDRIQMGSEELIFGSGMRAEPARTSGSATMSGMDPVVPAESEAPHFDSSEETCRVDALAMLGQAADRALAEGYVGRAEQMLSNYLTDVLKDALAGRAILRETVHTALAYGLKLAWATRNGAWFDYCVELLYAQRQPPPDEYMPSLEATLNHVSTVDLPRLRRYVETLVAVCTVGSDRQSRGLANAESLLRAAVAKQGR